MLDTDGQASVNGINQLRNTWYYPQDFRRALPLRLTQGSVWLGAREMPFSRQSKIFDLFRTFLTAQGDSIGRDDLLKNIYGVAVEGSHSYRLSGCMRHNVVKLISRGRTLANSQLCYWEGVPLEWFPYDAAVRRWQLVRPRTFAPRFEA